MTEDSNRLERSKVRLQVVDSQREGQRLDNWLLAQLRPMPRSAVYRLLRRGEVRVNGKRKKAEYRLCSGDEIRIPPVNIQERPATKPLTAHWQTEIERRILFEDDQFIVLDKPSGWAVHGGSGVSQGLIEAMRQFNGNSNLELVHRLDRDTSGCVLMAKTRQALKLGHSAFREGRASKRYAVLVQGQWSPRQRQINKPLERFVAASGERRVRVSAEGKSSRTDVELLEQGARAARLAVFPHTGRTHQIRVHCQWAGAVVVGDRKYGTDLQQEQWRAQGVTRLCLHAQRLRLFLEGQTLLDVRAQIPDDFEACWAHVC